MPNVPGWIATTYTYRATAVVTKTTDPSMTVSVSRFFQQADASLFQAMLFFQNDLELHPGPAMTLYGLVHTNSNLYAAAGSGGSLTFSSNVSYHGNLPTLNPAPNYKHHQLEPNGYVEGVTATLYAQEGPATGQLTTRPSTRPRATASFPTSSRSIRSAPTRRAPSTPPTPTPPARTRSSSGPCPDQRHQPSREHGRTPIPTHSAPTASTTARVCASSSITPPRTPPPAA